LALAIADFDGAHGPDLVVITAPFCHEHRCFGAEGVQVLLNQGDGTFAPPVAYSGGSAPIDLAVGDLDGANGPDLAVASSSANTVFVLLNRCASCPADVDLDAVVGVGDLVTIIVNWGQQGGAGDANQDGIVNVLDLTLVVANWGPCV
jgi:hypothetical protein